MLPNRSRPILPPPPLADCYRGSVQSLGRVFLPLRSSALHGTLKTSDYATINFSLLLSEILAARTSESSYRAWPNMC